MKHELESLQFLIIECKISACQHIIEAVIPHLENAGFTLEDFLNGLVVFFESRNYTRTTHQLEQAATALHHEIKQRKNDEAIASTDAN